MDAPKHVFSRRSDPFLIPLVIIATVLLMAVIAAVPVGIFALLQRLIVWTSGHFWRQIICTVVLVIIGFSLHKLRAHMRLLYGFLEMMVAGIGFWYALGTSANVKASAATIIASLYVFVRGVDNYNAGITEQHRRMGLDDQHRPLPVPPSTDVLLLLMLVLLLCTLRVQSKSTSYGALGSLLQLANSMKRA
jgi:hypothetical protein